MANAAFQTNFDPQGFGAVVIDATVQELHRIGQDMRTAIAEEMDRHGINVSGDTRASVTYTVEPENERIVLTAGPGTGYAFYVYAGTKPHWPPSRPIVKWVKKKLGVSDAKADSVAFLVQRKIAHRGTPSQDFLSGPFHKYGRGAEVMIARRIANEIANMGAA